jgi:hypothetical protein
MPTANTDVYPTFDDFLAEKILNGIGSHLMIGGGEPLLQHAQDEAVAVSIEDKDDPFDPWMPPYKELPQGFGGNSDGDENYAAHKAAPIGISSASHARFSHANIFKKHQSLRPKAIHSRSKSWKRSHPMMVAGTNSIHSMRRT